jgi:hypothetical protein
MQSVVWRESGDVAPTGDAGPMAGQHVLCVLVNLDLPPALHASTLKPEVEAADSGEQRTKCHLLHPCSVGSSSSDPAVVLARHASLAGKVNSVVVRDHVAAASSRKLGDRIADDVRDASVLLNRPELSDAYGGRESLCVLNGCHVGLGVCWW